MSEPANSKCVDAVDIAVGQSVEGFTTFATPSNADCAQEARAGVWYRMRINEPDNITLSTCSGATTFDTDIEVYTSCTDDGGVGCVDHSHDYKCTRGTIITFAAQNDVDYFVFVTGNGTDANNSGFFRLTPFVWHPPVQSSSSAASSAGSTSSSSSGSFNSLHGSSTPSNGMEVVEILLIIFAAILVVVAGFTVGCCIYKKHPKSKSYFQMDVPDGLDAAQSSTYVPPDSLAPAASEAQAP